MTQESDAAHPEVDKFLKSGGGQSIAQVAVILTTHRTAIQALGTDLHGNVANDTLLFTNQFPLAPGGGLKAKEAGESGKGGSTDDDGSAPGPPGPGGQGSGPGKGL
jgi:hypothetical protein